MRLKDRVYIVSGAAGGIGAGVCQAITAEGGHVVMTDLKMEQLEPAAAKVREKGSSKVLPIAADVSDVNAITRLVDQAASEFNRIDGCVTCAGIIQFCSIM